MKLVEVMCPVRNHVLRAPENEIARVLAQHLMEEYWYSRDAAIFEAAKIVYLEGLMK